MELAVLPLQQGSASSAGASSAAAARPPEPAGVLAPAAEPGAAAVVQAAEPGARPGVGGSRPGRVLQQRGEAWGPFSLAPIVRSRDGQVTGYGAICNLHADRSMEGERVTQTQCKKAFSCGTCRLLLERWLLRGLLEQDSWPPHRQRQHHVHMDVRELEQGPTAEEMDAWMENFMAQASVAAG